MKTTISHVNVWVRDQDEALEFYTDKLGFEVREDVTVPEFNNFRWLTVGPPNQPDLQLILCRTDAMPASPELAAKLADVVAQGAGGGVVLAVEDCRATVRRAQVPRRRDHAGARRSVLRRRRRVPRPVREPAPHHAAHGRRLSAI